MRLSIALLAGLFLVVISAVSDANIIFTPTLNGSSIAGANQNFSVRLALTGDNDFVRQFAFSATLSTAAGSPVVLVGNITSPDLVAFTFGSEFSHNTTAMGNPNGIIFSGTNPAGTGATFGPTEGVPFTRSRDINFTVARGGIDQTINITFAAATIPDPANPGLSGFVNGANAPVSTNFRTTSFAGGTITAVPEPTSIALLAMIGGIATCARIGTRKGFKKRSNLEA